MKMNKEYISSSYLVAISRLNDTNDIGYYTCRNANDFVSYKGCPSAGVMLKDVDKTTTQGSITKIDCYKSKSGKIKTKTKLVSSWGNKINKVTEAEPSVLINVPVNKDYNPSFSNWNFYKESGIFTTKIDGFDFVLDGNTLTSFSNTIFEIKDTLSDTALSVVYDKIESLLDVLKSSSNWSILPTNNEIFMWNFYKNSYLYLIWNGIEAYELFLGYFEEDNSLYRPIDLIEEIPHVKVSNPKEMLELFQKANQSIKRIILSIKK